MATKTKTTSFRRLCRIAARLNAIVVTVRDPNWTRKRLLGVCIAARCQLRVVKHPGDRALFAAHLASGGYVILLHTLAANRPDVLSHELGHVASEMELLFDMRMGNNRVSRVLNRVAARHGMDAYFRASRSELRAECIGRRLLGETLPPTLRRLTERSWADLHWKVQRRGDRF